MIDWKKELEELLELMSEAATLELEQLDLTEDEALDLSGAEELDLTEAESLKLEFSESIKKEFGDSGDNKRLFRQ